MCFSQKYIPRIRLDVMGGVGSGEIEGAAEMVARSVGQLGPVAYEHAHFEFSSLGLNFPMICAGCVRGWPVAPATSGCGCPFACGGSVESGSRCGSGQAG